MKTKIKLWARRLALRSLIKLVDAAEDRLHDAQVRLRGKLAAGIPISLPLEPARPARPQGPTVSCPYPFPEDEFVRHRIPGRVSRDRQPQRAAQTRQRTAADFDLRFRKVTP